MYNSQRFFLNDDCRMSRGMEKKFTGAGLKHKDSYVAVSRFP